MKISHDSQIDHGGPSAANWLRRLYARHRKMVAAQAGVSFGRERANQIFLEQRVGGRFFERLTDGEELVIGTVTAYSPPSRVVFTWKPPAWSVWTEVEVRFSPVESGTRVDLEHRGLEQAAPGEEKSYSGGWDPS